MIWNGETWEPMLREKCLGDSRGGRRRKRRSTVPAKFSYDGVDLGAVQNFLLQQRFGDFMEEPEVGFQEVLRLVIAVLDDSSDLGVDLDRGAFGVIDLLREISSQKDLFLFF